MDKLDLLDRKIMYELDLNARIPASKLAKKLRKSKETVNFRINRLLKEGYLRGFYTVFNTSQIGKYYTKYYLKFRNLTPDKEREIFDYLNKQDRVAYLASTEGYYDCMLLVMISNSAEMSSFYDAFMKKYGEFVQQKDLVTFLTTHRLNSRFVYGGAESKDWSYPVELGNYSLDEIDKKILKVITNQARMPLIEISKKIGVDAKVVKYHLQKLERDKIILAYVTSIGFDKLNLNFFQINISLRNPTLRKQVLHFFESTNKGLFAIELLGKYDLLVELHLENHEELKKIMDSFRECFVGSYTDYDISTINKEYLMVWGPFD
ncbi:MAG: Lrp/AsnC family transcriptional regulator [Candidatus Woesearchaeota archaeon]